MDNTIFFKYYDLIIEDKAQALFCINQDHPLPLHPFVDSTTLKVKFECLACSYKIVPGLDLYQRMRAVVEETNV